jgi:circadian clock protein KaiB
MAATAKQKGLPKARNPVIWDLWLFVADQSPGSIRAAKNLKRACEEHLCGRYHIKVIDVVRHPETARANQIVALPALIRQNPKPVRRGIGDLANTPRLLDLLSRD